MKPLYIIYIILAMLLSVGNLATLRAAEADSTRQKLIHRVGIDLFPGYVLPTHDFFKGTNRQGEPVNTTMSAHLKWAFQFAPDSYFGEEAKDGELLLSPGWNYEDGRVVDIFGKKFVVRNSQNVSGWVINETEMRALKDRFDKYREYSILTPDVDKLADDLIETGLFSSIKTKNIMYMQAMNEVKEEILKFAIVVAILIAIMLVSAALMFYSALLQRSIFYATGAALFVISDFLLGWDLFVEPIEYDKYLIMIPYYAAQWMLYVRATKYRVGKSLLVARL